MKTMSQGDDPPYLPVGTEVSAKYKGAFCEAKISKVVRVVKLRVTYRGTGLGAATLSDEQVRCPPGQRQRVGAIVQAKHGDKKEYVDATITKIQDCSQYTVVFDDGDITTLRRSALCLKSGRHFNESETLDQLPLTHPEHFSNPVVGGRRGRRSRQMKEDSSDDEDSASTSGFGEVGSGSGTGRGSSQEDDIVLCGDVGKVVRVELSDGGKRGRGSGTSNTAWFPGLIVAPNAQSSVRINTKDEYLVRSFKDSRYYTVPRKDLSEFKRETSRGASPPLTEAIDRALSYLDKSELPQHWDRDELLLGAHANEKSDSDDNITESSDDETTEEKDHFVAQLYKFMEDRGTPINKGPVIQNRDVDLCRLFRVVCKLGGYNRVTNNNKWRKVTARLGFNAPSASTRNLVKQAYKKFLFSYEELDRKLGCTMVTQPQRSAARGRSLIRDRDRMTPVNPQVGTASPKPEVKPPDDIPDIVEKKEKEEEEKKKPKPKEDIKIKKEDIPTDESVSDGNVSDTKRIAAETITASPVKGKEFKKMLEAKVTVVKETQQRKIKPAIGEKVKALVEKFESQTKPDDEEKIQSTRSKSVSAPRRERPSSPVERKSSETRIPPREGAGSRLGKPLRPVRLAGNGDEEKKRGRKKKDVSDDKSQSSEGSSAEVPAALVTNINLGDKLRVFYGPNPDSKVTYEAKVIDIDSGDEGTRYKVHYTGWNTRYDEWIQSSRVAENLSQMAKAKRRGADKGDKADKEKSEKGEKGEKVMAEKNTDKGEKAQNKKLGPGSAAKRGRGMSVSGRVSQDPPRSTTPSSSSSNRSKSRTASRAARLIVSDSDSDVSEIIDLAPGNSTSVTSNSVNLENTSSSGSANTGTGSPSSTNRPQRQRQPRPTKKRESTPERPASTESKRPRRTPKRNADIIRASVLESDEDSDEMLEKAKKASKVTAAKENSSKIEVIKESASKDKEKESESSEEKSSPEKSSVSTDESPVRGKSDAVTSAVTSESSGAGAVGGPKSSHKGRDYDLNQIRSELKGIHKITPSIAALSTDEKLPPVNQPSDTKSITSPESKEVLQLEEKPEKLCTTDDIYEFKEPEPFEFESRPKISDEKSAKKRLVPRVFDDSPIKKKTTKTEKTSPSRFRKTTNKKLEVELGLEISFDCLEESSLGVTPGTASILPLADKDKDKTKSKKEFDTYDPISLLQDTLEPDDVPEINLNDDEKPFFFSTSDKLSDFGTNSIFCHFDGSKKSERSDEDQLIQEAIERVIAEGDGDGDIGDDLISMSKDKEIVKELPKPETPEPIETKTETEVPKEPTIVKVEKPELPEPLTIKTELNEIKSPITIKKEAEKLAKQISPALQETDSSLLEAAISQQRIELKTEPIDITIRTGTKIADSILQKFNMIKKKEELPPTSTKKVEVKAVDKAKPKEEPTVIAVEGFKKRSGWKKVVSREIIESESDSSDSEERLIIARSDEDSQVSQADSASSAVKEPEVKPPEKVIVEEPKKSPSSESEPAVEVKTEPSIKVEEEPNSNVSILLCEETIPGSPAPVTESVQVNESRSKSKSSKSLVLEMPFASAAGSSNSKVITAVVEPVKRAPEPVVKPVLAVPETTPAIDNASPTTPDSTISNLSPRGEHGGSSPGTADESNKSQRDSEMSEAEPYTARSNKPHHYSEEDTLLNADTIPLDIRAKKQQQLRLSANSGPVNDNGNVPSVQPYGRKRRRSFRGPPDEPTVSNIVPIVTQAPAKRGRKPKHMRPMAVVPTPGSDSDDTSEHSSVATVPIGPLSGSSQETKMSSANIPSLGLSLSGVHRISKFNFVIELDPDLDGNQRVAILQQKLSELRKAYNDVKNELACIDRRRKKIRRREREALKAAKQEMACS